MNTIQNIIWYLCCAPGFSRLLIWYARIFLVALLSPKAKLAARLLAAESQLVKHGLQIIDFTSSLTFMPRFLAFPPSSALPQNAAEVGGGTMSVIN
jgi:hypothetical protein